MAPIQHSRHPDIFVNAFGMRGTRNRSKDNR
jgi:hypothetical protein